jgi:hypothetical protein
MKPFPLPPLTRLIVDAAALFAQHPPRLRNRNKQAVLALAYPPGVTPAAGTLVYTRWSAMTPPASLTPGAQLIIDARPDVYDYVPTDMPPPRLEWHVNFADPHLFVACASGLFAQDEMQVAEHPILASLKQSLDSTGVITLTVEQGRPTPILIRGAERRVAISTNPDPDQGRPAGLYGNHFAAAPLETVQRATRTIDPPTITNLIAIAAPTGGPGVYTRAEIEQIFITAYTAFAAAVFESDDATDADAKAVIHTGYWGCGAFGGNRVHMALLQLLAARLAGVHRLIFHTFDTAGLEDLNRARQLLEQHAPPAQTRRLQDLLTQIQKMSFRWGTSDGN